jgi:hypothetical protein
MADPPELQVQGSSEWRRSEHIHLCRDQALKKCIERRLRWISAERVSDAVLWRKRHKRSEPAAPTFRAWPKSEP